VFMAESTLPARTGSFMRSRSVGRRDTSAGLAVEEGDLAGRDVDAKDALPMRLRVGSWMPSPAVAIGAAALTVLAFVLVGTLHKGAGPQDLAGFDVTERQASLHPALMCVSTAPMNKTQCVKMKHHLRDESVLLLLLEKAGLSMERRAVFLQAFQEREELVEDEYMCISDSSAEILGKLAAALSEDALSEDLRERKDEGVSSFDPLTASFGKLKRYCPDSCTLLGIMNANEEIMMRSCCKVFY